MSVRLTSLERRALAELVRCVDQQKIALVAASWVALHIKADTNDVLAALRRLTRLGYVTEDLTGERSTFLPTRKGREEPSR